MARAHVLIPRAPLCYFPVAALNLTTSSAGTRPRSFYVNTLGLGPLADLGGVQPGGRRPAGGASGTPGPAAGPPRGAHVGRQCLAQRLGVRGVQVDLVLGAIKAETDRPFRLGPVEVVNEHSLYLLSHGVSFLSPVFWCTSVDNQGPGHVSPHRKQPAGHGRESYAAEASGRRGNRHPPRSPRARSDNGALSQGVSFSAHTLPDEFRESPEGSR